MAMELFTNQLIFLAAGLLLSTISLLYLRSNNQRKANMNNWFSNPFGSLRGRPSEDSKTPPRSTTPDKKTPTAPLVKDTLPPFVRDRLSKAAATSPGANVQKLGGDPMSEAEVEKQLIPFEANYWECSPSTSTPTGLTMEEVQALGDFPDYSTLSGVPLPNPYTNFDITKAIPRPYRPFRWPYFQTMSLSTLEPDWWLELEKTYVERIREREELFEKYGKMVLNYLPGSELGCKEIMETALQFLCARYPQHFSLLNTGAEKDWVFKNGLLNNETIIKDMHPLHVLLHNVPEDFAVMLRNPDDGQYYFRAGLLCSSLGWNVDTKIGKKLSEIHQPIPDYKEKMSMSMDRYFSRQPTSKPIQRGSWGLEIDTPLFMPPNDPHERFRLYQHTPLPLSRIHLRVDWQTLRRLPLSGAIIFNFKALFTPIEKFREERACRAWWRKC
ncbi:uncharacterized protein KY384_000455 [Bacidia gigantensis]|uniref:uncharacterized protein n=1 Tax=Bacidia gigantensis TaxID=2732470 RepID=UPI001D04C533|nr:uncharacterized protein KY384_000455 [Bacidia gigantensis]KAG8525695.1 hypothetical protein KY384_000455 [Bacidia gigantensis]